jgi:Mrp family chromosome partitioning ATPase
VDGVILVMDWEKNRRHVVANAVGSLTSLGVHVLGVVANRISLELGGNYGYGYEDHPIHEDDTAKTDRFLFPNSGAEHVEGGQQTAMRKAV